MATRTTTRDLPQLELRASFVPESLDQERRTIDLVWSTGARVMRGFFERYWEELSLDPKHVRMGRLNGGAPLLDSHNGFELRGVIGVVEKARIEKGRGVATVRFARAEDDPEADKTYRKVADGIIRNASVGYRIHRLELIEEEDDKIPVYRATDWEPHELSLVPIGADAGAGVRADGRTTTNPCEFLAEESDMKRSMKGGKNQGGTPAAPMASRADDPGDQTDETADDGEGEGESAGETRSASERSDTSEISERSDTSEIAVQRERKRGVEIRRMVRALDLEDSVADDFINKGVPLEKARPLAIDLRAANRDAQREKEGVPETVPHQRVAVGDDLTRKGANEGLLNALLHRAAPSHYTLEGPGRAYRGMTLLEGARAYMEAHGVRTAGLSKRELAGLALGLETRAGYHSTSDFPLILADVAGKTLRRAYEEGAMSTFKVWARRVDLPDFKQVKRTQLGEAPQLLLVSEAGEFTSGSIGEAREVYALSTYGRIFPITRQALINDDMDALSRLPMLFGRSTRDLESDVVYNHFLANPTMGDGVTLFHATHGNLGTGAISVAALGAGRAAMRKQTGVDKKQKINVMAKYLLVPAALETVADQFVSQNLLANQSSTINPFAGRLVPIAEPRLDAVSALEWYLTAESGQIDTLEYGYLEGEDGPFVESRVGFEVDGVQIKCRHDFAAKVIDHRGFFKSSGA